MCSLIYVFYHWVLRIISIRILLKVESDWCIRKCILLKNAWDVVQELEESQIIYTLAPGAKILNFCNKRPAGLIVKIESAIKMRYNSYNHTVYQIKLIFSKAKYTHSFFSFLILADPACLSITRDLNCFVADTNCTERSIYIFVIFSNIFSLYNSI